MLSHSKAHAPFSVVMLCKTQMICMDRHSSKAPPGTQREILPSHPEEEVVQALEIGTYSCGKTYSAGRTQHEFLGLTNSSTIAHRTKPDQFL